MTIWDHCNIKQSDAHREGHGAQQKHHRVNQAATVDHHLQRTRPQQFPCSSAASQQSGSGPRPLMQTRADAET